MNKFARWCLLATAAVAVLSPAMLLANSFDTGGTETVYYKGRPLIVEVPVGGERMLEFGRAIQVGLPKALIGKVQAESIAGTVYLVANEAFEHERFRFRDVDTGEILVLDMTARPGGASAPLRIRSAATQSDQVPEAVTVEPASNGVLPPSDVALVRHAFQSVYSPDRLVKPIAGMQAVTLRDDTVVRRLIPGFDVAAKPIAQWRSDDGRFVTAVYIRNLEQRVIELDPRSIRAGRGWITSSFLTGVLAPATNVGDATTLVVVSDGDWGEFAWLR